MQKLPCHQAAVGGVSFIFFRVSFRLIRGLQWRVAQVAVKNDTNATAPSKTPRKV
jgi:hypothetical protein